MRSVGMPLLESACGGLRGWERRVPALLLLQTGQSVGYSSIIRDAVSVGVEGRCYSIGMYVSKDWGDIHIAVWRLLTFFSASRMSGFFGRGR